MALCLVGQATRAQSVPSCAQCSPTAPCYAMACDLDGNLWCTHGWLGDWQVTKLAPDGTILGVFHAGGSDCDRGLAGTPVDNHIWIASGGCKDEPGTPDDIARLNSDGTICEVIGDNEYNFRPDAPTGVAVDHDGHVWLTHVHARHDRRAPGANKLSCDSTGESRTGTSYARLSSIALRCSGAGPVSGEETKWRRL